jgi:hypothetical protein
MLQHILKSTAPALHAQVLGAGGGVAYTVMFNTTAIHGLPAALNAASNALLRSLAAAGESASIGVRNHPMPTLPGEPAVRFSKVAGEAASPDILLHSLRT